MISDEEHKPLSIDHKMNATHTSQYQHQQQYQNQKKQELQSVGKEDDEVLTTENRDGKDTITSGMISSKKETITTTAIFWREHSSDWEEYKDSLHRHAWVYSRIAMDLRRIYDTIMNMDKRIRFVGVLDNNGRLIEGGMRKNIPSLLEAEKNDLFFLRILSDLKELEDFKNSLGEVKYIYIQMDKVSFVIMRLKNEDHEDDSLMLLVSMEPEMNPSFIAPSIRNSLVE